MKLRKRVLAADRLALLCLAAVLAFFQTKVAGAQTVPAPATCNSAQAGSPFVPVDSWIYPQMLRLYSLGYVDTVYLGIRPWTRASILHALDKSDDRIRNGAVEGLATAEEALEIDEAIRRQIDVGAQAACGTSATNAQLESAYTLVRGISGTPLRDSFHLGSTIINDYGRPYENGLNNYSGLSGYANAGRFTLYLRGEFQGAPSATGYSSALGQALATVDETVNPVTGVAYPNQATIPTGPIGAATNGRFLEAYVSAQVINHVISFGKEDEWLGPAQGASFAYSNNADNIYAFHINRIEPLYVPLLSRLTGPFRYEFLVGELLGHTLMANPLYANNPSKQPNVINPGNPWVHLEKINFKPTENLELGFERTALFGGEGHSPVTIHTFLKSFFSTTNVTGTVKNGPYDPGARFASFDFSYRLPFVRNWLTIYGDGEVHDDVSPADAPRRASWRPGLYLSHVPGLPKLDLRVEGVTTDPPVSRSVSGRFMYWEDIERQGYTNQGQIFGDWIGREDKGGQAWVGYHLSGNEWVQLSLRHQKAAKDFVPGGTTLNDVAVQAVKRIGKDFEVNGTFEFERWKAPVYLPGSQAVTATSVQLTWYPHHKAGF